MGSLDVDESDDTCQAPSIDHVSRHFYLFGYPITHSMSPLLHNTIFQTLRLDWGYFLLESLDMPHFLRLIRDPRCRGSGVTMPHKLAILSHLDEMTPECREIGSCNTVYWCNGRLVGHNTDTIGIRESFLQNSPKERYLGRPGMVVGGGGAARSAVYTLVKYFSCKTVYLVNRDAGEVDSIISWCRSQRYGDGLVHVSTAAQAEKLEGPGAIVACVPDFPPITDAEKEARRVTERFLDKPVKGAILEMCYHPSPWTELGRLSEAAGWQVILGTEAMIYQGLEQSRCWTGKELADLPIPEVKDVVARALSKARL